MGRARFQSQASLLARDLNPLRLPRPVRLNGLECRLLHQNLWVQFPTREHAQGGGSWRVQEAS